MYSDLSLLVAQCVTCEVSQCRLACPSIRHLYQINVGADLPSTTGEVAVCLDVNIWGCVGFKGSGHS